METRTVDKRALIDLLLKDEIIKQEQVDQAREEIKKTGLSIEKALEKLGFITEEDIVRIQANAMGLPYVNLSDYIVDTALLKMIPEDVARKCKVVPLFKIGKNLTIGMTNPSDIVALDQVRRITHFELVEPVLVSEQGFQKIIDSCYHLAESIDEVVLSISENELKGAGQKGLVEMAEDAPIIRIVNMVIHQAIKDRASDIHIEPEKEGLRVRLRIDGLLHELKTLPKYLQNAVISRVKILAKLDIAENRKPQDGRIQFQMEEREIDLRVSTFPTIYGENVVLRLLDKSSVLLGFKEIGFLEDDLEKFKNLIRSPNGIILVTGPTGSGKSTTLYAALSEISSMEKNIITIEDPVEYELPLIRQTQVNPRAGITFANGLRSILRQDPDIIMVGEIRDRETADVAIQSALTGHLVFSTLHTNDAASALTRLLDMGIEPFLISSSVIGVVAQRLVRIICEKCKEPYVPHFEIIPQVGIEHKMEFFKGRGCDACKQTGYAGRLGICELLIINEEIRKMIEARQSSDEIKKVARRLGMRTLKEDGLIKVNAGLTTLEEILRVTETE